MPGQISTAHPVRFAPSVPSSRKPNSAVIAPQAPALVHAGRQYEMSVKNMRVEEPECVAACSERVVAKFRVRSVNEASARISEAAALAELEAYTEQTRGVLVQRHEFDLFSVALSSLVPFGVTIEQDSATHEHQNRD